MNFSELFAERPWLIWGGILVIGYPLLTLLLGEIVDRLQRRGNVFAGALRFLRNVALPCGVVLVLLREVLGRPEDDLAYRVLLTFTLASLLLLTLVVITSSLFTSAPAGSWRGSVPKLFLDVSRAIIAFIGIALIISAVWKQELGGFFAALGVGSLVIGLALQDTLSSLFAGIVLLFEKPFRIGDIVRLGERLGRVSGMTWRATYIHLADTNSTLVIPNLVLAKESLQNFSRPAEHTERIPLGFSYSDPPNRVKEVLLDLMREIPAILTHPAPEVVTKGYGDFSINYEAVFTVASFDDWRPARDVFMTRLWYAVQRSGLNIPFPTSLLYKREEPAPPTAEEQMAMFSRAVDATPLGGLLDDAIVGELTADGAFRRFSAGEHLCRQETGSDAVHIILAGEILLTVAAEGQQPREVARLGVGEFLGLASILQGAAAFVTARALTDVHTLALPPGAALSMLDRHPRLARELGEVVEVRRKDIARTRSAERANLPAGN